MIFQALWHTLALVSLPLLPLFVSYGEPPWTIPTSHVGGVLALCGSYAGAASILVVRDRRAPDRSPRFVAGVLGAALLVFSFSTLLLGGSYSRTMIVLGSGWLVTILPVPHLLRRPQPALLLSVPAALVAASAALALRYEPADPDAPGPLDARVEYVESTHHIVRVERHRGLFPPDSDASQGGAIEILPRVGGYLLARGDGSLARLTWSEDGLVVAAMAISVPLNRARFGTDVDESVNRSFFRTTDIMVQEGLDSTVVLASHHFWKSEEACYVLRLSRIVVSVDGALVEPMAGKDWATVFETQPCLPIKSTGTHPFAGHQSGGKLSTLDGGRVLMTVGDHEFDGLNSAEALPQDPASDYGKTLLIDLASGTAEIFALGQRNPQGLHVDSQGLIWSTEHGPKGGDELNQLVRGGNYGWPYESHGADYGSLSWPMAREGGAEFLAPVHSWVPSTGVSAVASVQGDGFPRWKGDLLAGSLRGRTLWRLHLDGGRVAFAEPLVIGVPIRDVVEDQNGRIVIWTDSNMIITLRSAEARESEIALFQLYCGSCHKRGVNTSAPELAGIAGRPVASVEGFQYSAALTRLGGTWTEDRLREFLASPGSFAPGTSMGFQGIADDGELEAIMSYLLTLE